MILHWISSSLWSLKTVDVIQYLIHNNLYYYGTFQGACAMCNYHASKLKSPSGSGDLTKKTPKGNDVKHWLYFEIHVHCSRDQCSWISLDILTLEFTSQWTYIKKYWIVLYCNKPLTHKITSQQTKHWKWFNSKNKKPN